MGNGSTRPNCPAFAVAVLTGPGRFRSGENRLSRNNEIIREWNRLLNESHAAIRKQIKGTLGLSRRLDRSAGCHKNVIKLTNPDGRKPDAKWLSAPSAPPWLARLPSMTVRWWFRLISVRVMYSTAIQTDVERNVDYRIESIYIPIVDWSGQSKGYRAVPPVEEQKLCRVS